VSAVPHATGEGLALQIAEATDAREWNAFVDRAPDASFCHRWEWRAIVEETMGHRPLYQVARDGTGEPVGVLPLFRVQSRIFGQHLISVPFMNYGGPVGAQRARQELAAWAIAETQRRRARRLVLRPRQEIAGPVVSFASKITVVLDLPTSVDEMWEKSFDAKFRNKIKRPQREGMVTEFGAQHVDAYYRVFAQNMRDLGTPVLPPEFFERIIAALPQLVVIGVTYLAGRPVAGGFGFVWRDEFEMTWSASLKELRASKPNMLLYWDYMRELIRRGVRRFNFGRSTPGSGPHEFKRSWGGVDEPLPWVQWPPASGGAADEHRAAMLAASVWRHLPLGLTRVLGPALARQLPWW
jgi:serine/alanine adding enzyme